MTNEPTDGSNHAPETYESTVTALQPQFDGGKLSLNRQPYP
jgi:hypothetical protein